MPKVVDVKEARGGLSFFFDDSVEVSFTPHKFSDETIFGLKGLCMFVGEHLDCTVFSKAENYSTRQHTFLVGAMYPPFTQQKVAEYWEEARDYVTGLPLAEMTFNHWIVLEGTADLRLLKQGTCKVDVVDMKRFFSTP